MNAEMIKSALNANDLTRQLNIKVETFQDFVELSGMVYSFSQKKAAETLARGIAGVKGVANNIRII